jgi:hypothetical protein
MDACFWFTVTEMSESRSDVAVAVSEKRWLASIRTGSPAGEASVISTASRLLTAPAVRATLRVRLPPDGSDTVSPDRTSRPRLVLPLFTVTVSVPRAPDDGRSGSKPKPFVISTETVPLASVAAGASEGSRSVSTSVAVKAGLGTV